jgi:mannosyltransferase OCH1-like enzyme
LVSLATLPSKKSKITEIKIQLKAAERLKVKLNKIADIPDIKDNKVNKFAEFFIIKFNMGNLLTYKLIIFIFIFVCFKLNFIVF